MTFESEQLSLSEAIVLHLFPGAVGMLIFVALSTVMKSGEMPVSFWLFVTMPIGLISTELGYRLCHGKQRNGRYSLEGILG